MCYDEKIIRIALKMYEHEIEIKYITKILGICRTTLYNWRKDYEISSFPPSLYKNYSRKIIIDKTVQRYICKYVLRNISLSKNKILFIIKSVKDIFNVSINRPKIYAILKENHITHKRVQKEVIKDKIKKEKDITELKKKINKIGHNNIISIDETRIEEDSKPNHGWAPINKPVVIPVNSIKPKSCAAITAISNKKHLHTKFIEKKYSTKYPNKRCATATGIIFKEFLEELNDKLDDSKSYYLLMDNAMIHRSNVVKNYVATTNNKILFNVAYNPKTNPIETMFGAIKNKLRYINTSNMNKLMKNYMNVLNKFSSSVYNGCYKKSFNS
jgi:hypothetical protein